MRVTLSDIARALGLSVASVSMALRGRANISKSTQDKVQALAKKMGYVPDPLLSALTTHRLMGKIAKNSSSTIAFLSMWQSPLGWRQGSPHLCRVYAGMEEARLSNRKLLAS
jgi:LacI family transcriptional regulator